MRLIATMLAAVLASGPAAAQSWTEYSYPEDSFTVSFPAQPKVESTTQEGPDGRSVDTRIYSVQQDHAAFRIAIVDLSDAGLDETAVTDYAVKTLSQPGEVKLNIPARIYRVYGRQFSIVGADGSHSMVSGDRPTLGCEAKILFPRYHLVPLGTKCGIQRQERGRPFSVPRGRVSQSSKK